MGGDVQHYRIVEAWFDDKNALEAALRTELDAGADKKAAIAAVAGRLGLPKRHVYQIALGVR